MYRVFAIFALLALATPSFASELSSSCAKPAMMGGFFPLGTQIQQLTDQGIAYMTCLNTNRADVPHTLTIPVDGVQTNVDIGFSGCTFVSPDPQGPANHDAYQMTIASCDGTSFPNSVVPSNRYGYDRADTCAARPDIKYQWSGPDDQLSCLAGCMYSDVIVVMSSDQSDDPDYPGYYAISTTGEVCDVDATAEPVAAPAVEAPPGEQDPPEPTEDPPPNSGFQDYPVYSGGSYQPGGSGAGTGSPGAEPTNPGSTASDGTLLAGIISALASVRAAVLYAGGMIDEKTARVEVAVRDGTITTAGKLDKVTGAVDRVETAVRDGTASTGSKLDALIAAGAGEGAGEGQDSTAVVGAVDRVETAVREGTAETGAKLDELIAAGEGDSAVSGSGLCADAYQCPGDPLACATLREAHAARCNAESVIDRMANAGADDLGTEYAASDAFADAADPVSLDSSGFGWGRSCPALPPLWDGAVIPFQAEFCTWVQWLRALFLLVAYVWAMHIIGR